MEEQYSADDELEEETALIIEELFISIDKELHQKWLDSQVIPITVSTIMKKIDRLVAWATCKYDGAVALPEAPLEAYIPDEEPSPASIDSWARSSVPMKKLAAKDVDYIGDSGLTSARSGSVSSFNTSRKSGSRRGSKVGSRVGSGGNVGLGKVLDVDDDNPLILELEDDDDDLTKVDESRKLFKMLQQAKTANKSVAASEVSEQDEFASLQIAVEKAAKDLKGKKYLFDKDGKAIQINQMKPESLPPFLAPVKLNIKNIPSAEALAAEAAAAASTQKSRKNKGSSGKREKGIRVAGSREIEPSYFIPSTSLSTTLSSTEPVLNPGVVMRTGEIVREGGDFPEDSKRMTRKAYAQKAATTSGISGFSSSIELNGSHDLNNSTITFGASDILAGDSFEALPMSMSTLQSKLASKDLDPFEGSRRVPREN